MVVTAVCLPAAAIATAVATAASAASEDPKRNLRALIQSCPARRDAPASGLLHRRRGGAKCEGAGGGGSGEGCPSGSQAEEVGRSRDQYEAGGEKPAGLVAVGRDGDAVSRELPLGRGAAERQPQTGNAGSIPG